MRRGNASWINETRKKAKCNDVGVYSGLKDMLHSIFTYMTIVRLILAWKLNYIYIAVRRIWKF